MTDQETASMPPSLSTQGLFFRTRKDVWNKEVYPSYVFDWPEIAYTSREAAEQGLPDDHVVVTWREMESRISGDIQQDS